MDSEETAFSLRNLRDRGFKKKVSTHSGSVEHIPVSQGGISQLAEPFVFKGNFIM